MPRNVHVRVLEGAGLGLAVFGADFGAAFGAAFGAVSPSLPGADTPATNLVF